MEIIPAMDIIGGRCVRLTKGDYNQMKTYHEDPVGVAQGFESAGLGRLHLVDLDGAKARHIINDDVLRQVASGTSLHIDFGGGIKHKEDLERAFACGAQQVTLGSVAAQSRDLATSWLSEFGPEKIILGADVLEGQIMVSGWQEGSSIALSDYLAYYIDLGIRQVICTDISKDGMMAGPSVALYRRIMEEFPGIQLIASGGVTTLEDLQQLCEIKVYGAIVGKAIYEGTLTLQELSEFTC